MTDSEIPSTLEVRTARLSPSTGEVELVLNHDPRIPGQHPSTIMARDLRTDPELTGLQPAFLSVIQPLLENLAVMYVQFREDRILVLGIAPRDDRHNQGMFDGARYLIDTVNQLADPDAIPIDDPGAVYGQLVDPDQRGGRKIGYQQAAGQVLDDLAGQLTSALNAAFRLRAQP